MYSAWTTACERLYYNAIFENGYGLTHAPHVGSEMEKNIDILGRYLAKSEITKISSKNFRGQD